MNHDTAPVILFTYNRIDSLKRTIKALQNNILADETDLYIFSDGPKNDTDKEKVSEVQSFLNDISGFKNIKIFKRTSNAGLANSIIEGVNKVFEIYDSVIVLEDDLITSLNFLSYMNQCLKKYDNVRNVFSISGYSPPLEKIEDYDLDVYFFIRNSSHGWATWKDRWNQIDWEVSEYNQFDNNKILKDEFNKGGSDLSRMLRRQIKGRINSWSIRFCYHQYKIQSYTVYPVISKIQNIGFGKDATHTKNFNRFFTQLDNSAKINFKLPNDVIIDERYNENFKKFHSMKARAFGKFKTYMYYWGLLSNQ